MTTALASNSARTVDAVVEELRRRITDGSLPEGERLPPERLLAAQLGVSRPTLREGLSILAQIGLLTPRRGRNGGIVLSTPSASTVASTFTLLFQTNVVTAAQLTEVRRGLEVEAAQLAAVRRTDADVRRIIEALDLYISCEPDVPEYNRRGRQLHFAIAEASQNPLLVKIMYSLNQAFAECLDLVMAAPDLRRTDEPVHRPIVEAIAAQDADRARGAMLYHFDVLDRILTDRGFGARALGSLSRPSPAPDVG